MSGPELSAEQLAVVPDALLAELAGNGDAPAFEALARRHGPLLHACARRLTDSPADAEDVVQEALVLIWTGIRHLREPAAVKAWMVRITAHCAVSFLRRRRYHADIDTLSGEAFGGPTPEAAVLARAGITALAAAVARLPEEQRRCWALRQMGGLTYQEIADALDISTESVRGRLSRARTSLTKEMEAWR